MAGRQELNWRTFTLPELGLSQTMVDKKKMRSSRTIRISNAGNWSTKLYLPMGYLENKERGTSLFWQIEHNGSWNWEISDQNGHLYVTLWPAQPRWIPAGAKTLQPGERFETVPAAVGVSAKGFDDSMGQLTLYRRKIRRKNQE